MSLLQLFWVFVKVNLLSTSGPASVGLLYQEAVGKLVTEAQFVQAVGFSSVLPGSDALQLAMYVGYAAEGIAGGLAALAGSILPPTVIMLGVALLLQRIRGEAWVSSFVEGLAPAVGVVILFSAWKVFERSQTGWLSAVFGLISLAAMWLKAPARLVVIAAGIAGMLLLP